MPMLQTTKGLTTMKSPCGDIAAAIFFYGYWSPLGVVFDICYGSDWTACFHGPLISFIPVAYPQVSTPIATVFIKSSPGVVRPPQLLLQSCQKVRNNFSF